LTLISEPPRCTVSIDGRALVTSRGPAPVMRHPVEAGPHLVRVTHDGYIPWESRVELKAGAEAKLEVRLFAAPRSRPSPAPAQASSVSAGHGYLSVKTVPWSKVFLGGRSLGTTPLARVRVPAGTHRLDLVYGDGRRRQRRVKIGTDAHVKIDD
jgi:serine/threonine-protein kinase